MPYLPFEKELYILKLDFSHSPILQLLFHHNIYCWKDFPVKYIFRSLAQMSKGDKSPL